MRKAELDATLVLSDSLPESDGISESISMESHLLEYMPAMYACLEDEWLEWVVVCLHEVTL
eukprot:397160-Ditylum_brightwellii.AAC.1